MKSSAKSLPGTTGPDSLNGPPDVFLSYSRDDVARAEELAGYLESIGVRTFWDPDIDPASEFEEVILRQIDRSTVVLVCWSASALESEWVKREAELARQRDKYMAVTFDDERPPDDPMQIISLRNWYGGLRNRGLDALGRAILRKLGRTPIVAPGVGTARSPVDDVAELRRWGKLWIAFGACASYYALSMWIASQTAGKSSLGVLIDPRPVKGSLIALFVVGLLTVVSSHFLNAYAKRHRDEPWNGRIPGLSNVRPDFGRISSKWRAAFLVGFGHVLPLASLVHFGLKVQDGAVSRCEANNPQPVSVSWWQVPKLSELFGHHYCFGDDLNDAATDGVTFIPLLEPSALFLLVSAAFTLGIAAIWAVVRRARTAKRL